MKDHEKKAVNNYLNRRAELGSIHRNDRITTDKKMADAVLRGKLGCDRANQVIKAMDDLRSRGF
jgi:hypothetical protein